MHSPWRAIMPTQESLLQPGFLQQHHNWSLWHDTHWAAIYQSPLFFFFARHHSRHLSYHSLLWPLFLYASHSNKMHCCETQIWSCYFLATNSSWAFHCPWGKGQSSLGSIANKALHNWPWPCLESWVLALCMGSFLRFSSRIPSCKCPRQCVYSIYGFLRWSADVKLMSLCICFSAVHTVSTEAHSCFQMYMYAVTHGRFYSPSAFHLGSCLQTQSNQIKVQGYLNKRSRSYWQGVKKYW